MQLSAAVMLAQIADHGRQDESFDTDWANLLHVFHALDAYVRTYSVVVQPGQVLDLLVTDGLLPASIRRSADSAAGVLRAIGHGPSPNSSREALGLGDTLCESVISRRSDVAAWQPVLDRIHADSNRLPQHAI